MTWEEIIQEYEGAVVANGLAAAAVEEAMRSYELFKAGLDALRPVSREQVEKVWRGEWIIVYDEDKEITIATCSKCGDETAYGGSLKADDCDAFCPVCGAPMMDEAVQMVMERLEKMRNEL